MSHIFISYSTKNATYANRLAEKLRDEGFDVWIDNARLRAGSDWWSSIVKALWSCSAFIVLLSPESDNSRWVQREITIADNQGKPTFPILIGGDMDTANWQIFVRTQVQFHTDGTLPDEQFYTLLQTVAPRSDTKGRDVTNENKLVDTTPELEVEIAEPPPTDDDDNDVIMTASVQEQVQSRQPPMMIIGVLLLLGIVGIGGFALSQNTNAPGQNVTPQTQTVADVQVTDTPTLTDEPSPTDDPTATDEPTRTPTERPSATATPTIDTAELTETWEASAANVSNANTEEPQDCYAIGMNKSGVNARPGQGTSTGGSVFRLPYLAEVPVLDIDDSVDENDSYQWVQVEYNNATGWIREDFLALAGSCKRDRYPAPLANYWWLRGFNQDSLDTTVHYGWDLAAVRGEPIYVGPNGGQVVDAEFCVNCGEEGLSSVLDLGYTLSDSRILSDPGWNYGYGHYVTVLYAHDQLPEETRQLMAELDYEGGDIICFYAHLNTIDVEAGQILSSGDQIGTLGKSGGTSGEQLHLECRLRKAGRDITTWSQLRPGLVDPALLYSRLPNGLDD